MPYASYLLTEPKIGRFTVRVFKEGAHIDPPVGHDEAFDFMILSGTRWTWVGTVDKRGLLLRSSMPIQVERTGYGIYVFKTPQELTDDTVINVSLNTNIISTEEHRVSLMCLMDMAFLLEAIGAWVRFKPQDDLTDERLRPISVFVSNAFGFVDAKKLRQAADSYSVAMDAALEANYQLLAEACRRSAEYLRTIA